mmetsp:Transcript_7927/g.19274  ORF Transcript_7927/g.19274 Transcript_7927/m.19274 type:complete len:234 (-) Transcript_7927:1106-1807(-)
MRQRHRRGPVRLLALADLAADAVDACNGVEHVGRRVARKRQHLLVREPVVALTVHRKVRILDCREPHDPRRIDSFLIPVLALRQKPCLHVLGRYLHRLIEEVAELNGLAGPRRELLPVLPLDETEGHVLQGRLTRPPRPPRHLENLSKVASLARVGHVEDTLGLLVNHPLPDRRQVRRRVHIPAVGLLHEEGHPIAILVLGPIDEHHLRSLGGFEEPSGLEVCDHRREERVVE